MKNMHYGAALALSLLFSIRAFAGPCAGFTDVLDTSIFCPNVEWLKNRAITLGCGASTYCPASPVDRLAMAAFMNRLGKALTPVAIVEEETPGGLDVDAGPLICTMPPYAVVGFPRRVYLDATVSGTAGAALDVGASIVTSTDGGVTWLPVSADVRGGMSANQWANVSAIGYTDAAVGQTVLFSVRVVRADAGSADLSDSRCNLRAVIYNRDGTSSPY